MAGTPLEDFSVYSLAYVGGFVVGIALLWLLVGFVRSFRTEISRSRGAERPEWATGIWHCAACLSTNGPLAARCRTCGLERNELAHPVVDVAQDVIPTTIPVPAHSVVTLIHDTRAHADRADPHWRLAVGGLTVGSSARRAGAVELLRALDGADTVQLDVRGMGPSPYRLADLIARFEGPRFPLDVPCPEAADWSKM